MILFVSNKIVYRLCLQYGQETNMYSNKEYIGMIDALKKIYKVEGMRGLYKVTGISLFFVIDFNLQEIMSKLVNINI